MEGIRSSPDLEALRGRRGLFYFTGIIELLLGFAAISFAAATTIFAVSVLGWVLVLTGIVEFFQAFSVRGWSGTLLGIVRGVILGVLGFILAFSPAVGAAVLTLVAGGFILAEGVVRVMAGVALPMRRSGWLVAGGIASILLGIFILARWPISAVWMIGLWVGLTPMAS